MPSSADRSVVNASSTLPIRPDLWLLDPEVAHLNHGSYGAVPKPVLEAQRLAAEAIERSPERFYRAELTQPSTPCEAAWPSSRHRPEGLVLVQNATEAVQVAPACGSR